MSNVDYARLQILIADDFSNFRATVKGMLDKLGVDRVELASSGAEALRHCEKRRFDIILCDYDLGSGKNGQHVLEELRARSVIDSRTVFIIVSADTAKDVVMAAYDCTPDDYLMKPITAKMLSQRMNRLLLQRKALAPVHSSLKDGDIDKAMALLIDLSITESRYSLVAQKLLGELFIEVGELGKAEKLYTLALETRQVDWARLGLAKVRQMRGDLETSKVWLEKIVEDNPLFLPAYDVLATNWEEMGQKLDLQKTVQRSVDISPRSILRQKRLAEVAENNGDLRTALKALRETVKLGELSIHASPEDNLNFARVAASNIEKNNESPGPLSSEAIEVVAKARERFTLDRDQLARANLLEGRAHALGGDEKVAKELIDEATMQKAGASLQLNMEKVAALRTMGEEDRAEELVQSMLQQYAHDEEALEKLDRILPEPVSEQNRNLVSAVNREGIELYNGGHFDQAIACFERARVLFPKHVGIQLNIVQALIGKLRAGVKDAQTLAHTEQSLQSIGSLVEPGHAQYERFIRLQEMASSSMDS